MANTNELKSIIEPDIIDGFCRNYRCEKLSFARFELKQIFFKMEPDLVAYNKNKQTLYIGEITVSGYNGRRGKDYHVGAVKKLAESFSKYYLFTMNNNRTVILERIKKVYPGYKIKKISCHFIVPEGSKFIKALGWRKQLLGTGIMRLDEISLSIKTKKVMLKVLDSSKKEMMD